MRLVCLIGQLARGGSERQLYLLLKQLASTSFECHVAVFNAPASSKYHEQLEALGVQVWNIAKRGRGKRLCALIRLFRTLGPDVVHSWSPFTNPYAGVAGYLAGVRTIVGSVRGWAVPKGWNKRLYRLAVLRSVSQIIVNSKSLRDQVVEMGCPKDSVTVIPNCVETCVDQVEHRDLSEFGIKPGQPVVGIVGNFRGPKNHLMYIRSMARVLQTFPEARGLMIGGRSPAEPHIGDAIVAERQRLGLEEHIILTGVVEDAHALMPHFSVLCLTSRSGEGMPNVILEAMAASIPVVATEAAGVSELVVDGETGFLTPTEDEDAVAEAIIRLLSDPLLARRMGAAGLRRVKQRHSCQDMASRFVGFYKNFADC